MRHLWLVVLLYATSVQADFKTDKSQCDEWGKAFYLVAEWRDIMSKSEAYDKILSNKVEDTDYETTVNMLRIVYLVFDSQETSENWKKAAIATCMKQRGHMGA